MTYTNDSLISPPKDTKVLNPSEVAGDDLGHLIFSGTCMGPPGPLQSTWPGHHACANTPLALRTGMLHMNYLCSYIIMTTGVFAVRKPAIKVRTL